ncbi:major facilitator superfamily domain-containing protein [Lasiosphaeria hispida]|uniref:Major facilitator superfamily domain-containing protein n=1 Tax=Lasiosphaeria hispida TaxID=260671 RepID=A0AAJ0H5I0_9PEZI|nr:major facilitator superfamily domain-containing protein [Lasiosphaeria hispida]
MSSEQAVSSFWGPLARAQLNPEAPGVARGTRIRRIIDNGRLVKRLFWVGASGFFARSYAFFSGNIIKLELLYIYPPCGRLDGNPGMALDEIGHVAAVVSMLVVGNLADLWGRKRLYGYELLLLIVATLGVVQASEGFRGTMDIYAWLAFWRFCLGLAIGAEQPLVAIITAEWVRTKSRGRMMAAIFAVQPLARLVAYGVALAALQRISSANGLSPDTIGRDDGPDGELAKRVADRVWRLATGLGIIPALVAIGFRFTIPETPLYYADILLDAVKGANKSARLYMTASATDSHDSHDNHNHDPPSSDRDTLDPSHPAHTAEDDGDVASVASVASETFRRRKWYAGAVHCLRSTEAGRNLALLSALWMASDMAWYCLSMESLASASTLWPDRSKTCSGDMEFASESTANPSLYRELEHSATRFMLVVSIGSLLGSAALIAVINRFHRRVLLMATCGALAVLFAVTGSVLLGTGEEGVAANTAVDVLFGVMHFLFTLGPRTLILILAAELFPTVYRGTFYSIAGAAGRIGAIAIRPVIGRTTGMDNAMGIRLVLVVLLMVACVAISYFLPEVQRESRHDDTETGSEDEGSGSGHVAEKGIRAARRRARGWVASLFPKLETMTLEEIAPNLHERSKA